MKWIKTAKTSVSANRYSSHPSLDGGRMNAFDACHRFKAQAFKPLLDDALNLLFRSFKVVEGRSIAVAECLPALTAAEDYNWLTAPQPIAAVIG
jgi:hypothetical protein